MVAHTYDPRTQETEAKGQSKLYNETLSKKRGGGEGGGRRRGGERRGIKRGGGGEER